MSWKIRLQNLEKNLKMENKPYKPKVKQLSSPQIAGMLPPQAIELEQAVIGAIMIEPSVIEIIATILQPCDFYKWEHEVIAQTCYDLVNAGKEVDFLTVSQDLKRQGKLEEVGGNYLLAELSRNVSTTAHIEAHARIIKECSVKRQIIKLSAEMQREAFADDSDAFDLHDQLLSKAADIVAGINRSKIETIGSIMTKAIAESHDLHANGIDFVGYRTGIKSLDNLTGGFANGDFIILAAGTGEGKSTLALNIANNIASEGVPTLFFTLEMKGKQLAYKILSEKTETTVKNLRIGNLSQTKWANVYENNEKYSKVPLYINDRPGLTVGELCSIVRAMVKTKGIKIAFVDYLQLLKAGVKVGLREQEVNYISKELRALSLELDIPIVALSQLSRIEKSNNSRLYQLSDLRESGAIEQDAVNVLFIFKPILPNQNRNITELTIEGYGRFETSQDDALVISAKNRNDATGAIRLKEQFWASRFVDFDILEQAALVEDKPSKMKATPENLMQIETIEPMADDEDLPF